MTTATIIRAGITTGGTNTPSKNQRLNCPRFVSRSLKDTSRHISIQIDNDRLGSSSSRITVTRRCLSLISPNGIIDPGVSASTFCSTLGRATEERVRPGPT